MKKNILLALVVLTFLLGKTSVSYAQWGEILGGLFQAATERYIDNNSSYSSAEKENMKSQLNVIGNAINSNQNAANAARDAYQGNYTGAVIQGAQTLMNATGNHNYDTYLNSANQINNANREYNQNINNGMDSQEALDKRNKTMGYSAAESVIELQDKIARERAEKARQQREAERQSWSNNSYYSTPSYNETYPKTSASSFNKQDVSANVPEESWQILRDYGTGNKGNVNQSNKADSSDGLEESWKMLREYATNIPSDPSNDVLENREYNRNVQILSSNNIASFLSDEGKSIYLYVLDHSNGGTYLSFYNHDDSERRLICNKVTIKLKYVGDDTEQIITDACSFTMPPHTSRNSEWSDVFFNVSDTRAVESIEILFVDTQIR